MSPASWSYTVVQAVFLFVLALAVLIFIHELGHLLVAKKAGMQVDRFSVGFGPVLCSFRMGETSYQLALIPLGGFVDIPGMNLSPEERARQPRAFASRPVPHRVAVLLAGVTMNLLFGLALYTGLALTEGVTDPAPSRVLAPGKERLAGADQAAWIEASGHGTIVRADGEAVEDFGDLASALLGVTGGSVELVFADGTAGTYPVPTDPEARIALVEEVMPAEPEPRKASGVAEVAAEGLERMATTAGVAMRSGELVATGALGLRQLSGPVGLAAMSERVLSMGWARFLSYIAFISVSLGIMNLLPIPTLDGGHAVFVVLEGVLGRPLSRRAVRLASVAGGALLVGIMLIATTSDVLRLFMM